MSDWGNSWIGETPSSLSHGLISKEAREGPFAEDRRLDAEEKARWRTGDGGVEAWQARCRNRGGPRRPRRGGSAAAAGTSWGGPAEAATNAREVGRRVDSDGCGRKWSTISPQSVV